MIFFLVRNCTVDCIEIFDMFYWYENNNNLQSFWTPPSPCSTTGSQHRQKTCWQYRAHIVNRKWKKLGIIIIYVYIIYVLLIFFWFSMDHMGLGRWGWGVKILCTFFQLVLQSIKRVKSFNQIRKTKLSKIPSLFNLLQGFASKAGTCFRRPKFTGFCEAFLEGK